MSERWRVLTVLWLARTAMGVQFQAIAALGPELTAAGMPHATLGALIGIYLLPGIALAIPGGWLGSRIGEKRLALTGLAAMVLGGILTALTNDLSLAMAGRLIAGMGAVALNVIVTKMVADWFGGTGDISTAMGLLITSWPLGIALSMVVLPTLSLQAGMAAAHFATIAFVAVAFVALAIVYRAPGTVAAVAGSARLTVGEVWRVSLSGLAWMLYNVSFILLLAFGPDLSIAQGAEPARAIAVTSLIGWLIIPTLAFGGVLADRVPRPDLLAMGCLFIAAALCLVPLSLPAGPLLFFAMGLLFGPPGPLIMTLPVQAVRPEARSLGMGVYWTWYYLGMGIAPSIAGALRDATGAPVAPVVLAGGLAVAAALFILMARQSLSGRGRT